MDPVTGLPDRTKLMETLVEMISEGEKPALFAVAMDGYDDLAAEQPAGAEAAMREVGNRLSKLVRSNDVLAVLGPGLFALAGPGVEEADAEVVLDRVRGVFAMPVEVGGEVVSFPVTVGIAPYVANTSADEVIVFAEADLSRRRG
ncbi:MAG: GGDEF domain-containing protein [Microthrixaceae bacterium]